MTNQKFPLKRSNRYNQTDFQKNFGPKCYRSSRSVC